MGDEASQEDEAGVERVIEQNKCVGREREGLCCARTRLLACERLWSHIEQPFLHSAGASWSRQPRGMTRGNGSRPALAPSLGRKRRVAGSLGAHLCRFYQRSVGVGAGQEQCRFCVRPRLNKLPMQLLDLLDRHISRPAFLSELRRNGAAPEAHIEPLVEMGSIEAAINEPISVPKGDDKALQHDWWELRDSGDFASRTFGLVIEGYAGEEGRADTGEQGAECGRALQR